MLVSGIDAEAKIFAILYSKALTMKMGDTVGPDEVKSTVIILTIA